jgi:hypothetical protein
MLRLGRAQAPVAIGGRRRDPAAEGVQQLLRHGVRGHANADAVLAAGDDVVDVVSLRQNQGQWSGPEFVGQLLRDRRYFGNPAMQVPRIVQMNDDGMIGRAALDFENLAHGNWIGRIRSKSIDGLGGEHHQVACTQRFDGRFDFSLCSSYHGRMISRLRCEQRPAALFSTNLRVWRHLWRFRCSR